MLEGVYIGFDFGYKRIGMAVGQRLSESASPLATLKAIQGVPQWEQLGSILKQWQPQALIVGLPTCIDDKVLYTTAAARNFARALKKHFSLPVHLIDERLSTVEARAFMFAQGGYRKLKNSQIDSIAACIILEQFLGNTNKYS